MVLLCLLENTMPSCAATPPCMRMRAIRFGTHGSMPKLDAMPCIRELRSLLASLEAGSVHQSPASLPLHSPSCEAPADGPASHADESPVYPFFRHQFVVRSPLHDAAAVEHDDLVCHAHRGQAMRDHEYRLVIGLPAVARPAAISPAAVQRALSIRKR